MSVKKLSGIQFSFTGINRPLFTSHLIFPHYTNKLARAVSLSPLGILTHQLHFANLLARRHHAGP